VNHPDDVQKIDAQTIRLAPGGGGNNAMQREYQQGLYLLLAVSAAVLLIACANLANLLLVRGAAQRTSIAVEIAMGASRSHILRRQLIESLVLSLAGGAAGLLTAIVTGRAILAVAFRGTPQAPIAVSPSLPILAFTFAVSVVTGVLFGAGPAWLVSRADPADALRGSVRVLGGEAGSQRLLVVLQAAMSLVLITVAALLSQSLRNLDRQPFGFETDGRLVVAIDPLSAGYAQPQLAALYRRLDDRLSRVLGVTTESLALYTAQGGNFLWGARIFLENAKGPFPATWDRVGPRYFETVGTPLVRGRTIDEHDTADAPRVAVVNETFAARYFSNGNPIGHRFGKYTTGHANDFEIVGVVKDAKYVDLSQAVRPMFFVPLDQAVAYDGEIPNKIEESSRYVSSIALAVHGDPDAMQPLIRAALADVDPNLAPKNMRSVRELDGIATSQRTLTARLSDAFGIVGLLLAAVGLYGVTAYRVTRRRHEIGLRMALGATSRDIAAMVIRGACSQTIIGLLVGVPLAVLAARALQSQLFGVSPFSVPVLLLSSALVGTCAVVASALPARRASALAPMDALSRD
jgi:predicted permease